jgi:hypothetical protein
MEQLVSSERQEANNGIFRNVPHSVSVLRTMIQRNQCLKGTTHCAFTTDCLESSRLSTSHQLIDL